MKRRHFLHLTGLGLAGLLVRPARAQQPFMLPTPDLSASRILRCTAGLRPHRQGSYRLEVEPGTPTVIHNYGHGGSGFTMAPGCAQIVADYAGREPSGPVAVVGGGISGLFCAWRLREAGRQVNIYAEKFSPHTTSDMAGAFWGPSGVAVSDRAEFNRILQISIDVYRRMDPLWGVSPIDHYHLDPVEKSFWRQVPPGMLETRIVDPAPFESHKGPATLFKTVVISPPILLRHLHDRLGEMGVIFQQRKLERLGQLQENLIVNCTGIGSAGLVGDSKLSPVRGQLVHLEPQNVGYSLTRGPYMIPRSDALVLGGTYERGETVARPRRRDCLAIVRSHELFFGGWLSRFPA